MGIGTLGMIMTSPGQTYSESIFIEYIINDLAITRTWVSALYSFGTLVGGFSLPFWGKQIDRQGTRKMMTIVAVLFGLSCIYMGFVQNAFMVGLGFILVRMLGQGSLGLISQTAINIWWVQKRGMIMGISGLLMAIFGMGAFPGLVYRLISAFDWRMAYIILGFVLLLVMAPIGFSLIRNHPETYGLHPDGASDEQIKDLEQDLDGTLIEENWTLKEAMRTPTFWVFALSNALFALLGTGFTFHLVSIFQTQGLEPTLAASIFLPIAIVTALSTLLVGYLSDHMPLRYLLAIGLFLAAVSMVLGQTLGSTGIVILFAIIFGGTNGISRIIGTIAWPSFFGRKHLGSIYGFTTAIAIFGAALGPLPFGYAYDLTGSYCMVLLVTAGVCLILGLVSLITPKPHKA